MFLKLKDKEQVKGVFRGAVKEYWVKWEGSRSQECPPDEEGAKFRFKINFVMKENGVLTPKIWEGGMIVYNQLKDLHETFSLPQTIVTIKRSGSGKDTLYTIMPSKEYKVTPEMERLLQAVKLHDLDPQDDELPEQLKDIPHPAFDEADEHLSF